MTHAELITDRQVTVVVEHIKPEKLYQYILSMRRRGGMRLIAEDGALRELFRALRRGEAIALAADRDVTESGRVIPFFGAPAKLPDGYALLALKFGCPVLPSFIIRAPGDRFEIHIAEPMLFQGRADQPSDVQAVMASVVGVTEKYIERYIDQWVYFHYVWEDGKNDKDGIERTQREQTGAA
jgi:KDO2-lipid IV(A) lauroyltransferase